MGRHNGLLAIPDGDIAPLESLPKETFELLFA